ncbi:hypothetical protein [Ensifer sp. BR816]|uniref:hypothetical protein n=1 Tax=Rhizobium sp. (strain BR816) TaxID=1057002 RepID=UPI000367971B|nr:hypothetical protein [Ensifer sp. BR816]
MVAITLINGGLVVTVDLPRKIFASGRLAMIKVGRSLWLHDFLQEPVEGQEHAAIQRAAAILVCLKGCMSLQGW